VSHAQLSANADGIRNARNQLLDLSADDINAACRERRFRHVAVLWTALGRALLAVNV
jgi:hypothetical protein